MFFPQSERPSFAPKLYLGLLFDKKWPLSSVSLTERKIYFLYQYQHWLEATVLTCRGIPQ
jgi:hypothetical protein